MKQILKILNNLLDLLFPPVCIGCNKKDKYLCLMCVEKIELSETKYSENIYPIFNYRNKIIKKALWNLKYKGHTSIAIPLAIFMYDRILEELSDLKIMENFNNPLLIPIPLSKKRLKFRGFNQSEAIAREIYKIDEGRTLEFASDKLYKIKETESQMKIKDRAKRLKNLTNCFEIKNSDKLIGRNIILIDDITTTGATINEARNALLKIGAQKVIAFTVAH